MPRCRNCDEHLTKTTCRVFDLDPVAPQSCPRCGVFDGANGFRAPRSIARFGPENPNAYQPGEHANGTYWPRRSGGEE